MNSDVKQTGEGKFSEQIEEGKEEDFFDDGDLKFQRSFVFCFMYKINGGLEEKIQKKLKK